MVASAACGVPAEPGDTIEHTEYKVKLDDGPICTVVGTKFGTWLVCPDSVTTSQ